MSLAANMTMCEHTSMVLVRLTRKRIAGLRLRNHSILPAAMTSPAEAVRHMLAMQGQDFRAVVWAIALRTPSATASDVFADFDAGRIVRSWPMRGTLHAMAAEDLGWMLSLTAERIHRSATSRRRQLGIDAAVIADATQAASEALSGGRRLDRAGILRVFEDAGIETTGQRGYHLISILALDGLICWGPPAGTGQALVLSREWIRAPRRLDRESALGEAVARYLESHGPATVEDFAWWSGLPLSDSRLGLAVAEPRLAHVEFEGADYWMPAAGEPPGSVRSVRMLPGFDEYILGYRDRRAVLAAEHADRIVPGGNGIFLPTILTGEGVAGTWSRAGGGRTPLRIEVDAFTPLSATQRASLRSAVRRYGRFLGQPAELAAVEG